MSKNFAPQPAGITNPTQKGMLAGNPRDSAIAANNQTNQKMNNLANAVGGKRKRWGGATSTSNLAIVPTVKTPYTPTGGPGQTPTDVQQQNAQTTTQATANAVYDNYATQKGGIKNKTKKNKTKRRRGGSSKWDWGCYSGGRKSKSTKSKSRK